MSVFEKEVIDGLSKDNKSLSSKWFYDEIGDKLFIDIMNMPEYYLKDCELEIFQTQAKQIINSFGELTTENFDLFELGASDGTKTIELLKDLSGLNFTYRPIDISSNTIQSLESRVGLELPHIKIKGLQGEYFNVLKSLETNRPKVVLFLGSNIGNLLDDQANQFLLKLSDTMSFGDKLLLGVDLKKPESIVLPAYNDMQGITAQFNLNLLSRINRELGANFNLNAFKHAPEYSERSGYAKSYLESLEQQEVRLDHSGITLLFAKGEKIFMEVSRKYNDETLADITKGTSFGIVEKFTDSCKYFCDVVFEKLA